MKPKLKSVVRKIESFATRTDRKMSESQEKQVIKDDTREVIIDCKGKSTNPGMSKQTDLRAWLNQKKGENIQDNGPNTDSRTIEVEERKSESSNTSDIKKLVHNINTGPSSDILSKNNYLEMTRGDYRSLTGRNYLNDKIIDEYIYLIKERNQKENLPSIGFLPVHVFKLLDQDFDTGYERTRNWIKEDLTQKDIIFVPIHQLSHWSLIAVDMKSLTISLYDSIIGSRRTTNAPKLVKKHIERYCRELGKESTFTIQIKEDAPIQRDTVNCGVFLCQNAEKLARQAYVNTRQEDMPKARLTMMQEIFKGSLSAEVDEDITETLKLTVTTKYLVFWQNLLKTFKKNRNCFSC